MGSIYACMFAEAGCSTSVVDIWREHIDRIREFGLRIEGASGNRIIKNIFATTEISELDVADLYVIATKADGVSIAARGIARVMDPSSLVLTIQNGLGADERISKYMPINNVLLGVAEGFGASMKGPGHVHHNAMRQIRIGEMSGGKTRRLEWVESIWQKAGFFKAFSDIHQLVWEKFICNVLCSAPATVFECNIGELFKDPGRREVALGCMMEAYKIGCAKGSIFRLTTLLITALDLLPQCQMQTLQCVWIISPEGGLK